MLLVTIGALIITIIILLVFLWKLYQKTQVRKREENESCYVVSIFIKPVVGH